MDSTAQPRITPPETLAALEAAMLRRVTASEPGKTVDPTEIARVLAGPVGADWGALMPAVRRIAVRLANEGRIAIYRKGKQADPNDFKGLYRLAPVRQD
jgi:hypothetical protein